jgi:hypothetical protein
MFRVLALALAIGLVTGTASADIYGLSEGAPDLQSAGALAFGPDGILFVGDVTGAAVFAIRTGDQPVDAGDLQIEDFTAKLAEELGVTPAEVQINDLAVNPATGNVFFSLGLGPEDAREPSIVRLGADGGISPLDLSEIAFSKATLPDAPADEEVEVNGRRRNYRPDAITDLAFIDGQLLISGMTSNTNAPTSIRSVLFPFAEVDNGTNLEIFHAAHGGIEDNASIRTFVPIIIDGEPNILAGFVCTPLVRFPISEIGGGEQIEGTTVAELGNRNRPFDLISYEQDGENFLLMANSARGVMKISTEGIDREEGITEPIPDGGTGGQTYETIDSLAGTVQLDKLNDTQAVVLIDRGNGSIDLHTVPLP